MRFSLSFVAAAVCPAVLAVTLDVSDASALQAAAKQSISNLLSLYVPNSQGVYEQASTPWFVSGLIFDMVFDYARYTGDNSFSDLVIGALANVSYSETADILGGASNAFESLSGKWNDDIGWMAIAVTSGSELYGGDNEFPGTNAPWLTVPKKTLWEMAEQLDNACGGGIYWSRNRLDSERKNWKSAITNWEYTLTSARVYDQTNNQTVLSSANQVYQWLFSSGLASSNGTLSDGMNAGVCTPSTTQWSYTHGAAIGTMAWLNKATGQPSYLATASSLVKEALSEFAPKNIFTEANCESTTSCNRDQQHFKNVLMRNLAYLYRVTDNEADKTSIRAAISGTIDNMVPYCNDQWICPGNWSNSDARVAHYYPADLHASSSLLVSALGVFQTISGPGLVPTTQASTKTTGKSKSTSQSDSSSDAIATSLSSSLFALLLTATFWAF